MLPEAEGEGEGAAGDMEGLEGLEVRRATVGLELERAPGLGGVAWLRWIGGVSARALAGMGINSERAAGCPGGGGSVRTGRGGESAAGWAGAGGGGRPRRGAEPLRGAMGPDEPTKYKVNDRKTRCRGRREGGQGRGHHGGGAAP